MIDVLSPKSGMTFIYCDSKFLKEVFCVCVQLQGEDVAEDVGEAEHVAGGEEVQDDNFFIATKNVGQLWIFFVQVLFHCPFLINKCGKCCVS